MSLVEVNLTELNFLILSKALKFIKLFIKLLTFLSLNLMLVQSHQAEIKTHT